MSHGARSVKPVDKRDIPLNHKVKAWCLGDNLVEVMSMEKYPMALPRYRKVDQDHYVDLLTGEVLEYQKSENRSQNVDSMRKTIHKIRRTINNNFSGGENELFITLTYAENMTDTVRLYRDFDLFFRRLRYMYKSRYDLDYINVIEPQGRGAWHSHLLLKDSYGRDLYIPNADIQRLWGHGFTKTKRLRGIDNIGAYLSAYLTDVEINQDNMLMLLKSGYDLNGCDQLGRQTEHPVLQDDGSIVNKRFLKGARLKLYPSGINILRCSRGIKKPVAEEMSYSDVKKITGCAIPDYSKSVSVVDSSGDELNAITYENYNLIRHENQDISCK